MNISLEMTKKSKSYLWRPAWNQSRLYFRNYEIIRATLDVSICVFAGQMLGYFLDIQTYIPTLILSLWPFVVGTGFLINIIKNQIKWIWYLLMTIEWDEEK